MVLLYENIVFTSKRSLEILVYWTLNRYSFNFATDIFQAPIKVFGVEGRYTHALFSAASKSNSLEKVEKELGQVQVM